MKKFYALAMLFAAAAMTFASCANDDIDTKGPKLSGKTKTITVSTAITRTSLNDRELSWSNGDQYGIFYADATGDIIGYITSPEYDENVKEYDMEIPAEAEYLYCFYPLSAVSNTSVTGTNIVEFKVDTNYDYSDDPSYLTYMASNTKIENEKANIQFKMLNAIIEFNIYDSTGEDTSNLTLVRVKAPNCSGTANLSFADGEATLSEGTETYSGMDIIPFFGDEIPVGSEEKPAKFYLPVIKGTYTDFTLMVNTENGGSTPLEYKKGAKTIDKDYYTAKIDISKAGEDNGGNSGDGNTGVGKDFTTAEIPSDLGFGDTNATINYFREFEDSSEEGANINQNWGVETSRTLDITSGGTSDLVAVRLISWPTNNVKIFTDALGQKEASGGSSFQGGTLLLEGYGKYWVIFYNTEDGVDYPYGYIYVNYHKNDDGGDDGNGDGDGDDNNDSTFVLADSSKSIASLTKAAGSEDWATVIANWNGYGSDIKEYWELTTDGKTAVDFSVCPEWNSTNLVPEIIFKEGSSWQRDNEDTNKGYWKGTWTNGAANVMVFGENISDSAEYIIVFMGLDRTYTIPQYALHVVCGTPEGGDEGGNEGGEEGGEDGGNDSGTFTVSDISGVTLKKINDFENDPEYSSVYNSGYSLDEMWKLTYPASVNDELTFTVLPISNISVFNENKKVLRKNGSLWQYNFDASENWFRLPGGYSEGTENTVYLHGDYDYQSTEEFIVLFPHPTYHDAQFGLHVVMSK